MTAFDLIDSIFSRPQQRISRDLARITAEQLKYLRDLIRADLEGVKTHAGALGSVVWSPSGKHKYVLTEDPAGRKHTLARLSSIEASESGRLF